MTFTAWRIIKRKHAKSPFSGIGARKYGGRWNSAGTTIVYTAQTQSLAVLEMLVHLDGPELLQRYVLIGVQIDESFVREISPPDLPRNWRVDPAPVASRQIGDRWIEAASSAVLRVPSTLVPAESNFLLNPAHPDFKKLVIGDPIAFDFDQRLVRQPQAPHWEFLADLAESCRLPADPADAVRLLNIRWESKQLQREQFESLHWDFMTALTEYVTTVRERSAYFMAKNLQGGGVSMHESIRLCMTTPGSTSKSMNGIFL